MLIKLQNSILPLLAVIFGIAINAFYLRLFAEYFGTDIFLKTEISSAFGLELGPFTTLIFFVLTIVIIATIGVLSDYWGRKTILVFTATLPIGLLVAFLIIFFSLDDIYQAEWMLSLAWILIFVIYCSELAVSLCYLIENNNKVRTACASFILFAVFWNPLIFLICSIMLLVLWAITRGFHRLRKSFFPYLAKPIIGPNLLLYLDYSVLFISLYFVINVILPLLIDIQYLMLVMLAASFILPFARWFLLKNNKKINKESIICLNIIAPIAKIKTFKLVLSFIGLIQFVAIMQFFSSVFLSYILNQLDSFAANILSQFVNFVVPFAALNLSIIADQMSRKWILRYSGLLSIIFIIVVFSYCSLIDLTLMGQANYFIAIMVFLTWLILGGAALAIIPLIFIAENCSRQRRGLFVSTIIAIYLCVKCSTLFAVAQLWLSGIFQSPSLLWGMGIVFLTSAIIGFISLKLMQETVLIKPDNL